MAARLAQINLMIIKEQISGSKENKSLIKRKLIGL